MEMTSNILPSGLQSPNLYEAFLTLESSGVGGVGADLSIDFDQALLDD